MNSNDIKLSLLINFRELVEHHIKKHSFDFKSLFLDETAQR